MRQKLLLLEDVDKLGRTGEIISVKSGYARNYLVPKKKAVVAKEHTLRMQKHLQDERAKLAILDKKDSEELSNVMKDIVLETIVKVDPEGKMYGSVSQQDILHLLEEKGISLDKKNLILKHPIKATGTFNLNVNLKEGIVASCVLNVIPEGGFLPEVKEDISPEEPLNEESEEAISEE
jgi:large subunit ribosomal protein L9